MFDHSLLFISARSPFARRVRLAFDEHTVPYSERVVDLFGDVARDWPDLIQANPLVRLPTLILKGGERLVESHIILQLFYEGRKSHFWPVSNAERLEVAYWSSLATGVCEKAVEIHLEHLRPAERRDPEFLRDADEILERTLSAFERRIGGCASLLESGITQADLDWGTALTYLSIRYAPLRDVKEWARKFPECWRYAQELERRPSFARTRPPT